MEIQQKNYPSIALRDPSIVAPYIDACADNRSPDGAARSIDSAYRSIARNIYSCVQANIIQRDTAVFKLT